MSRHLLYVCAQRTLEGQASYAHVHEIVRGLRERGWSVKLVEPSYGERAPGPVGRLLHIAWLQLRCVVHLRWSEVVYCRFHVLLLPLQLTARILGRPVIQEVNGPETDARAAYPWLAAIWGVVTWLYGAGIRAADGVITVTPELSENARRLGAARVVTIPNGADVELFTPDGPHGLDRRYALFFGAFSPWQGIEVALTAAQRDEWPGEVELIFAGAGPGRSLIEAAAEKCPRIRCIGVTPYRHMPALIRGAVVCLIPKTGLAGHDRSGLSPLKLYEAISAGSRVVVSDLGGLGDFVREAAAGWVVPPGDAAAIARAVAVAAAHPIPDEERRRLHDTVAAKHSWEARAEASNEFILDLIQKRSPV